MDRRAFVSGTFALFAAPLGAEAQQAGKTFRIGILTNVPPSTPTGARTWGAFMDGLHDLGYVEGQNITVVHRSSQDTFIACRISPPSWSASRSM